MRWIEWGDKRVSRKNVVVGERGDRFVNIVHAPLNLFQGYKYRLEMILLSAVGSPIEVPATIDALCCYLMEVLRHTQ